MYTPKILSFREFWMYDVLLPSCTLMFILSWLFLLLPKTMISVFVGLIFKLLLVYHFCAVSMVFSIFSCNSLTVFGLYEQLRVVCIRFYFGVFKFRMEVSCKGDE